MLLNHLNTPEIDMIDMVITSILRSTEEKKKKTKQTIKTSQVLIDYPNVTGLTNHRTESITIIMVILAVLDQV